MHCVELNGDLAAAWDGLDPFVAARLQEGTLFKQKDGRRTLRFALGARHFFLKHHAGVGWREILKNLLQLRLPVLDAGTEYRAARHLERCGVPSLRVAGFGWRGVNPAGRESFLVTEELGGCLSLERLCASWPGAPPAVRNKRLLIGAVAELTRRMHGSGLNHRDLYLCHILLEPDSLQGAASAADLRLHLVDLHRAQLRAVVPRRWRAKDLGALYFSAMDIGLTRRDLLRFLRTYFQAPPRTILQRHARLLRQIERRARSLRRRGRSTPAVVGARELIPAAVFDAGRGLTAPFSLLLPGDSGPRIEVEEILRLLPGRRLVARVRLDGRELVLKLFARRRHWRRELAGLEALREAGLPVPELIGARELSDGYLVLLQFLSGAQTLERRLGEEGDDLARHRLLAEAAGLVARMHAAGLCQEDIHLGNFLLTRDRMYLIDGGTVRRSRASPRAALDNFACFFAQLGLPEQSIAAGLLAAGGTARASDGERLGAVTRRHARRRAERHAQKAVRDCSAFAVHRNPSRLLALRREHDVAALHRLVAGADRAIARGRLLKNGNTASVALTTLDDRPVVIKRYNLRPGLRHLLSRAWRPSRAVRAWQNAERLGRFGVATPAGIAAWEERRGWLRGRAFLLTEYVDGMDLAAWVRLHGVADMPAWLARDLRLLFEALWCLGLSHGDLKASNLIVSGERLWLLDLDSMRRHRSEVALKRAIARDRRRLLGNWDAGQARQIEAVLRAGAATGVTAP